MELKAGTIVKHGTSLDRLPSIREKGLLPGSKRNFLREKIEEIPVTEGIYVGENLSYFGALAAFTSFMSESLSKGWKSGDLPVVLHIQVKENCELTADEDYIQSQLPNDTEGRTETLKREAEYTWVNYKSGSIVGREIPLDWITKIEFPYLMDFSCVSQKGLLQLEKDMALLVRAYWQTKAQATITEFNKEVARFKNSKFYCSHLSNINEFSDKTFMELNNYKVVNSKEKLYEYSLHLWQGLTERMNATGLEYEKHNK